MRHVDNEVFTSESLLYCTTAGKTPAEKKERAARIVKLHRFAESLIEKISGYDAQCEEAQETDTGEAWELFNELRTEAEEILGVKP